MPPGPFVLVWGLAWAFVGCLVALGIVLLADLDLGPALRISILFAEVVGFTALVSARLIFPLFVRLPYALSLLLQMLTLLWGAVFGSFAVVALYPLLSLRQYRLLALIILGNALIAIVAGIALYTYDTMRRQIERSYHALREKEQLDREVRIARDVQQQLLPTTVPRLPGIELAGVCIPAVGVGGDYFDFLELDEHEVGLLIADVSGKGIPAALLMAGLQGSVRSLMRPGVKMAALTTRLNEILFRSSPDSRYATMFIGSFDTTTRTLSFSNAGHHPPIVIGRSGVETLEGGGRPIGLFDDSSYGDAERRLEPGNLLALFTDGIVEAPNQKGDEFGGQRLIDLLRELHDRPLDEIVEQVLEALRVWTEGTPTHDDVTLVLARAT
jgi:serine phosphatase RsbU (regulator of sigma subunit)